ncbi:MAG: hypothetical protein AB1772_07345 [Candidatus Zixiibacteriota bacterium]
MSRNRIARTSLIMIAVGILVHLTLSASVYSQGSCCVGRVGNADGSGGDEPTIGDVTTMIGSTFIYGWQYCEQVYQCVAEADINQSGGLNPECTDVSIGDITILIDYLFITGSSLGLPDCLQQSSDPHGYAVGYGGCKGAAGLDGGRIASMQTCVSYSYDGSGILALTHVDAGLNCCPVTTLGVSITGDTIRVSEYDLGLCDCSCLYDIEYRVENLPTGSYRIVVDEAIPNDGEPLDFTVDLALAPTGVFCVARTQYPWGGGTAGYLFSRSDCKTNFGAAQENGAMATSSCIEYVYDGYGTLMMTHVNAGLNCCPTEISAQFSFEGSTITVTEIEDLSGGGCHCLCLYDLEYRILNLAPGEYRLVIIEPYVEPPVAVLDFTLGLTIAASGVHCVERTVYPWGQ